MYIYVVSIFVPYVQVSGGGNPAMEKDLVSTKHELLKVRDMLEMAEKVSGV